MAKAENTVIIDGQKYNPGDTLPDFKSITCVDTREPRKYQGLSTDLSVLNNVIAKYASGGASCFMSDTGEYYEYDREEKTWKLITNITERGFDSEKAYGALKHMFENVVSDDKIKSAVTDYLTLNPVLSGATAEQAQQIEQNKTDVASLKEETGSLKEDLGDLDGAVFNVIQEPKDCTSDATILSDKFACMFTGTDKRLLLSINDGKDICDCYVISVNENDKFQVKGRVFNDNLYYPLIVMSSASFSDNSIEQGSLVTAENGNYNYWGTGTETEIYEFVIPKGVKTLFVNKFSSGSEFLLKKYVDVKKVKSQQKLVS
jgi:hypothetical protein